MTNETKTAEEIYLDSLNLPITNSATRLFWEETLRVFKEQQLTQQQEVNAELKKQNEDLKLLLKRTLYFIDMTEDGYTSNLKKEIVETLPPKN